MAASVVSAVAVTGSFNAAKVDDRALVYSPSDSFSKS